MPPIMTTHVMIIKNMKLVVTAVVTLDLVGFFF